MLDSVSSIEYIPCETYTHGEEAAGKVGKWLGVIAAIAMPFAAPAIFGAVASSGILGAGLASAATAGTMGTLTSVLGSAVTGGLLNAGLAYAGGARGAQVWGAGLTGAAGAGLNAYGTAATAANAATTAVAGANPAALAAVNPLQPAFTATGEAVGPVAAAGASVSNGIMSSIRNVLGNIDMATARRVGAAVVNAAVNGGSMGRLDSVVAQQKAELDALKARDLAAYNQKIGVAQQLLADADREDPAWRGRIAMADVAGMEANASRQAMRNIAVRQGGSFDSGQQKAYERSAALHTARSKALAYNQEYENARNVQGQLRGQAAGLLGPDAAGFQNWNAGLELAAGQERAHREADNSTWGGLTAALFEHDHTPATSPDPSAPARPDDTLGGFFGGMRNLFGGQ